MTGRSVPEWIANHPDQAIPERVKLRIWQREDGRCYLSGIKIRPGDKFEYEHKVALSLGGEHRENNIFLALADKHKAKTAADRAAKADSDRVAKKHLGIKRSSRPLAGSKTSGWKKKLNGQVERRT